MKQLGNWFYWNNPFKTYNKIKHIFKPLTWKMDHGPSSHLFCIEARDVSWKDKWNSPRFEQSPFIYIDLFYHGFLFRFTDDYEWIYWETILDYLYYNKTIEQACEDNVWQDCPHPKTFLK